MNPSKDKLTNLLRRLPDRTPASGDRGGCPDEEALADYLGGNLAKDVSANLEEHLAGCSACTGELAAAYQAGAEEEVGQAPQVLVERLKGLVPDKQTVFDLVVRLTQDTLELMRASVPVTWPVLAASVRGGESPAAGKALRVSKDMGRFKVTVELEAAEKGSCQLDVHVSDELGRPAEGVRLGLSSGGREQASFLTSAAGDIVFGGITPADYQLTISDRGGLVGAIELSLTQER